MSRPSVTWRSLGSSILRRSLVASARRDPYERWLETEEGGLSRYPVKEKVMLQLRFLGLVGVLGLCTMHCGTDSGNTSVSGSGGRSGGTGGSSQGTGGGSNGTGGGSSGTGGASTETGGASNETGGS